MTEDGLELYSRAAMVVYHFTLHPGGCNDSGRPRTIFRATMVVDHFTLHPGGCNGSGQPCRCNITMIRPGSLTPAPRVQRGGQSCACLWELWL